MRKNIKKRIQKNHLLKYKWFFIGVFGICFFAYLFYFAFFPKIQLKGDKKVVLNYKEKYLEKGYKANYFGDDLTSQVKISGDVKSKKLGTYKIVYKVKKGVFTNKVVRKVVVKDTEKPKMDIDNKPLYVCPGDEVVPIPVKVIDNYDGDISKKVQHSINKDKTEITYTAIDKSGNKKEVVKKIYYKDIEPPTLTLNGGETIYLVVGEEFTDPSVKVSDNCDKDIKVEVEGKVNINQVGDYTLTYKASDKAKNKAEIKRVVSVSERKRGAVYLTFDDGPNSGTTDVILDILKEEGVKATFFVTNKGPDELIKREFDEGHTVALHTASHDYARLYASDDAYFADLYSVQDRVKRITGEESKIIRFPGGSSNTISRKYSPGIMSRITEETKKRGFRYYDWNISSGDASSGSPTPDQIYNNVVTHLNPERVNMVLMHDIKSYTRDALKRIIQYGKENGYHFEKITMDTEMITQRVNN